MRKFFLTFLFLTNIFLLQSQGIEIRGNDIVILSDGSNSPNVADQTVRLKLQFFSAFKTEFSAINVMSFRAISA